MSDTTSEHDDLSTTQEYTIAGIVILFFGLLYWLFNYGFPDVNFNTSDTQPATALVADSSQTDTQNQRAADTNKPDADTDSAANAGTQNSSSAQSADSNQPDTAQAGDQQQFATKQAGGSNGATDTNTTTQQLQVAQSVATDSSAATADADDKQSDKQSSEQSADDTTKESGSGGEANDETATQNVAATDSDSAGSNAQQQVQAGAAVATAAASSLAQRVITDPAVLKLRDHLLNGELEQPVQMDSVSFADKSAEAELSVDTQVLDLAALMQQNPDTKMLIRGHTAKEGSEAESKTLSLARATALGQQLVEAGAAPGNIIIMGMGDAEPLSNDNKQQNRGKNRRIDVAITQ